MSEVRGTVRIEWRASDGSKRVEEFEARALLLAITTDCTCGEPDCAGHDQVVIIRGRASYWLDGLAKLQGEVRDILKAHQARTGLGIRKEIERLLRDDSAEA